MILALHRESMQFYLKQLTALAPGAHFNTPAHDVARGLIKQEGQVELLLSVLTGNQITYALTQQFIAGIIIKPA